MGFNKGLTGIEETARGFVGGLPKYDETAKGKSRIRFDIGCGVQDIEKNKYATWRHCIAYGLVADNLKNAKRGDLLKVRGWVTTEANTDDYGRPIIVDEKVVKREYLICYFGEILEYQAQQKELPLEVSSVSSIL